MRFLDLWQECASSLSPLEIAPAQNDYRQYRLKTQEFDVRNLRLQPSGVAAAATVFVVTFTGSEMGLAQTHSETQAHSAEASAAAGLRLNNGSKWETDAPLRSGMSRIRSLVEPESANAGKLGAARYVELAGQIEGGIGSIIANCKLSPEADAMLHIVIGDLLAGSEVMAAKSAGRRPQQGLVQVATAINDYATHFDHPGFVPIPRIH